jgi:cell division protein FtsZ
MEDQISVTVIATGFKTSSISELNSGRHPEREKVSLVDDPENIPAGLMDGFSSQNTGSHPLFAESPVDKKDEIIRHLYPPVKVDPFIEAASPSGKKAMQVNFFNESEDYIEQLSKIPAYERRRMKNPKAQNLDQREMSRYTLSHDSDEGLKLKKNNSFLHDKAD